jgi:1-acyl-sn-glycerol-3-phosphate acyltransferase
MTGQVRKKRRASQRLARWLLSLRGWQVDAQLPPADSYVIIAAPHTSNWDFPIGILAKWALGLRFNWLGKHSLFSPPHGWLFRALGGIPVYRHQRQNLSEQLAAYFQAHPGTILALTPEGTRSRTSHWKSGFYHIARQAGVPVALGHLDYGRKRVGVGGWLELTGDREQDMQQIAAYYADITGKHPEQQGPVRLRQ